MEKKIKQARECGLSLLQISKKDLEHGLELHRKSIVFDSYGFAPSTVVDSNAILKIIEEGASQREIQDLVEESRSLGVLSNPEGWRQNQEAWAASGVTAIFQNTGEESQNPEIILKRLARFTHLTDMLPDFYRRATKPEDVITAKRENRHCLYFTTNGVPLAPQWVNTVEKLQHIRTFFQLGCRMMHLTYNRRNMLGDGCMETANAGLSNFGQLAIAELNNAGIIPDGAHSGWQTCIDAAKATKKPMVISHSACYELNSHPRNKPDEVIKKVIDTGGYISICTIPAFLGGKGDLLSFLDHLEYAIKKFGADHVAIGTDSCYMSDYVKTENEKIAKRTPRFRPQFQSLWQKNEPLFSPEWNKEKQYLSLSWTNWPLFTAGMVQRGFKDDDIRKVIGGNVLRVAEASLR